jgi:hypothetical protein
LYRALSEPLADCQFISSGSFVGKLANFCAMVLAWHIKVKRVACTKNLSVDKKEKRRLAVEYRVIVP